ncbi:MAG: tyrosine-type recombinase/integrase [Bauldia sp.]|nr:tyrosine-type recombinase/integrase [Bauldia sp.]
MALVNLRYVKSYVDRLGKPRHYFRRNGKTTVLPGQPGSAEFMDAYAACLSVEFPAAVKRQPVNAGTFDALAGAYFASPNFLALSSTTQRNYRRVIDSFLSAHGRRRVDQLRREHVDRIIGAMHATPSAAQVLLKRIRTLLHYATALGMIDRDPTKGARAWKSKERHTWTEEEIAQFETRWPIGSKQRLGFALLLYTGQRGSDVHRMIWSDIAGSKIRVVQQKTGEKLSIAIHPKLSDALASAARDNIAIMVTEWGRAFTVKGFGNFMSAAIRRADLPDRCVAHGLRKAAARRLAEAGCTVHEIMAVTGHKTLAEVERYTRAADQERLSEAAVEKQSSVYPRQGVVSNWTGKAQK